MADELEWKWEEDDGLGWWQLDTALLSVIIEIQIDEARQTHYPFYEYVIEISNIVGDTLDVDGLNRPLHYNEADAKREAINAMKALLRKEAKRLDAVVDVESG